MAELIGESLIFSDGTKIQLLGDRLEVDGKLSYNSGGGTLITKITASSSSTTLNFSQSNHFKVTMSANTTFTFSNLVEGQQGIIYLVQDASSNRSFTLPSVAKTPKGGAAIAQVKTANTVSILSYTVLDTSNVLINYIGNFS